MNKSKKTGMKKPNHQNHRTVKEKTARKWLKWFGITALFAGIAGTYLVSKKEEVRQIGPVRPTVVKLQKKVNKDIKLPPAFIDIKKMQLNKGTPGFREFDLSVESTLKSTGIKGCSYSSGDRSDFATYLHTLKNKLESAGFKTISDAKKPHDIFERIFLEYLENNVLIFVRNAVYTNTNRWITCIMREKISEISLVSFSLFMGGLEAKDVPVYFLKGKGLIEQDGIVGGLTFKQGSLIYPEVPIGDKRDQIHDIMLHEIVHYAISKTNGKGVPDILDFESEANQAGSPQEIRERERNELRAYLVQTIYGKNPRVAMRSALMPGMSQHYYAQMAIKEAARELLREKQDASRIYSLRGIKLNDLTSDEIRQLAYRIYLKHFHDE